MAKGYHVLAGVCRDIGNALRDDADGSQEAAQLLDALDELLELLYDRSDGEIPLGQESDESGIGNDATDEESPMGDLRREVAALPSVGSRGQSPSVHSTRARAKLERRPSRTQGIPVATGTPRAVRPRGVR